MPTQLPARPSRLPPFHLLFLVAALQACGGQAPATPGAVRAEAAPATATCAGASLAASNTFIYVAADGADADSCGDRPENACASIGKGIARCAVAGCAVLVRHGLYPSEATIVLRDAVSVHGSCRFGDEPDRHYRTVVAAAPAAGLPAIDAVAINSPTALSGIVVLGKNETAAGAASIAMRIGASRGLALNGMTLAAGRGGDGAPGISSNGGPGGDGQAPPNPNSYGAGSRACAAVPASGGKGGDGRAANTFSFGSCGVDCICNPDAPLQPLAALVGQDAGRARGGANGGSGGSGGNCIGHPNVTPGNGAAGLAGELGDCSASGGLASADLTGRFAGGRWLAGAGGAGGTGGPGSGGGGGGAGGYSSFVPVVGSIESYSGYPGSGGGGGGCGGPGGAGGQQGGASIALALLDTAFPGRITDNNLVPGPGGNGGPGAVGGAGGPGGAGGAPVAYPKVQRYYAFAGVVPMPGAGNGGGAGGAGGAGSGGAGGNGGPAFGIALMGTAPDPGSAGIYAGTAGMPGKRGAGLPNPAAPGSPNSLCRSADGQDGLPGSVAPIARFMEAS